MNIDQNKKYTFIDNVIKDVSIETVIGKYLDIKKKGNQYVAICPFHADKNPSLFISQSKNIWKCFSCNVGGNSLAFIKKLKSIGTMSAIEIICNIGSLEFKKKLFTNELVVFDDVQLKILEINKLANKFYSYNLFINELEIKKNKKIINYFQNRQIHNEILKKSNIGYADNSNSLIQYLISQEIDLDDALKSGLVIIDKNNKYLDYFRNRIIIPIYDINNNLLGFSSRSINDDNIKYLNLKTTELFQKSKIIYNLNNLVNQEFEYIFIVEGFFDLWSFVESGINNVISIMGVQLSNDLYNKIKLISNKVVLGLDNDFAGYSAMLKYILLFKQRGFDVYIISYGKYKDANEVLIHKSKNGLNNIIQKIYSYETFLLNKYWNNNDSDKQKDSKLQNISNILAYESNVFILQKTIEELAHRNNIDKDVVTNIISKKTQENKLIYLKPKIDKNTKLFNNYELKEQDIEGAILFWFFKYPQKYTNIYHWYLPSTKIFKLIYLYILSNELFHQNKISFDDIDKIFKDYENYNLWRDIVKNTIIINQIKYDAFLSNYQNLFKKKQIIILKKQMISKIANIHSDLKYLYERKINEIIF